MAPSQASAAQTALKQAEADRDRSHSLLQATLDATTDAILAVDLEGRITAYNRPFAELWPIPQPVLDTGDDAAALASVLGGLTDPDGFVRRVTEIYQDPESFSQDIFELVDGRTIERDSAPQRLGGDEKSDTQTRRQHLRKSADVENDAMDVGAR